MPMVFVLLGAQGGPHLLALPVTADEIALTAEVTLALLFADAAGIDHRSLRADAVLPTRFLLFGLPLSVLLGTGGGLVLYP